MDSVTGPSESGQTFQSRPGRVGCHGSAPLRSFYRLYPRNLSRLRGYHVSLKRETWDWVRSSVGLGRVTTFLVPRMNGVRVVVIKTVSTLMMDWTFSCSFTFSSSIDDHC